MHQKEDVYCSICLCVCLPLGDGPNTVSVQLVNLTAVDVAGACVVSMATRSEVMLYWPIPAVVHTEKTCNTPGTVPAQLPHDGTKVWGAAGALEVVVGGCSLYAAFPHPT